MLFRVLLQDNRGGQVRAILKDFGFVQQRLLNGHSWPTCPHGEPLFWSSRCPLCNNTTREHRTVFDLLCARGFFTPDGKLGPTSRPLTQEPADVDLSNRTLPHAGRRNRRFSD